MAKEAITPDQLINLGFEVDNNGNYLMTLGIFTIIIEKDYQELDYLTIQNTVTKRLKDAKFTQMGHLLDTIFFFSPEPIKFYNKNKKQ